MKAGLTNCLIITDGRQGIRNQAIGLAAALKNIQPLIYSEAKIKNSKFFHKLNTRLQYSLIKLFNIYRAEGKNIDIAIGCGRQAIAPLIDLKEKNPNIFTIYVQDPKYENNNFDLVIAPEHDALKGELF